MVHCGYEPTAVDHTFSGFGGIWGNIKAMVFSKYANPKAKEKLLEQAAEPHGPLASMSLTIEGKPFDAETSVREVQEREAELAGAGTA